MKITEVITHQLLVNVDEPFTSSRGWYYKTKGAVAPTFKYEAATASTLVA